METASFWTKFNNSPNLKIIFNQEISLVLCSINSTHNHFIYNKGKQVSIKIIAIIIY